MKSNHTYCTIGFAAVLLTGLTGCTTYVERPQPQRVYVPAPPPPQPVAVYVQPAPPPPAVVVIQNNDDFVQPLSPYGEWVVVGDYGRCWRPSRVEAGWRPYATGHWESTGDGWYWVSDEPWAWATYHYGRWQLAGSYGWVWVPQTEWAPAWVSWRSGGGYIGWAPMPPEPRGGVSINVTIAPAAFCFVEERRMHEPVRPTTVIVNNTTIINKTVIINKTKVVNKVVINEGPRVDEVERVSGRKIQQTPIADLRHHDEEPVAETHVNLRAGPNRKPQPERNQPSVQPPVNRPEPAKNVRPQDMPNRDRVVDKPAPVAPPVDDRAARDRQLRDQNLSAQPPQRGNRPDAPAEPVAPDANTRNNLRRQQQQDQQQKQDDLKAQRQQEQLQKQQDQKQKQLDQQQKQQEQRQLRQQKNNAQRNPRPQDAPRDRQGGETNAPENPGQPGPR